MSIFKPSQEEKLNDWKMQKWSFNVISDVQVLRPEFTIYGRLREAVSILHYFHNNIGVYDLQKLASYNNEVSIWYSNALSPCLPTCS